MNSDIRLAVSFRGHRKRKRLRQLLGDNATDYLIDLWLGTAMNHPGGLPEGMTPADIALEAGWEGEPETFITAMVESGFLDANPHGYALHDWAEHQSYAIHAEQRKSQAREAANARWRRSNAARIHDAQTRNAGNNATAAKAQCPQPSPSPVPAPVPHPTPVPEPPPFPAPSSGEVEHMQEAIPVPHAVENEQEAAQRLALLMRDTLKAHLPAFREPNIQQWVQCFARALRTDPRMRDTALVAEVITWACSDGFWRANMQHPDKLRDKFDQLAAKMEYARSAQSRRNNAAERRVADNQQACVEAGRLLFGDVANDVEVAQ